MLDEIRYGFDAQVLSLTELVLADYAQDTVIDRMDTFNQPDQEVIVDVLNKLLRLIYPGHFREGTYKVHSTRSNLSMLVEDVAFHLKNQIAVALKEEKYLDPAAAERIEREAQRITIEFFKRLPSIRSYIRTDLEAAYDGDPAAYSLDEIIIAYPGLFAITINRIAHELYQLRVPLIPRIMTEYAHSKTGIDIHPGATLGRYFFIDHGTGIVVGETTVIGDHVKLYQGVTLGALSTRGGQQLKGRRRHPTIEDNVTIYAGASILGGDTVIGRDSVIGSNVFITKSVPAGTRVSIKNQELVYRGGKAVTLEADKSFQDESWCYEI